MMVTQVLTPEERERIRSFLRRAFEESETEALLMALEEAVASRAGAVVRRDLQELMHQVALGRQELQAALARLAEAQAHADERVGRLEEGQRELQAAVARLAEAQARTEQALHRLARQVGGLSETVGGDIEDIAAIVVHDVLKRELGWEVGALERAWQRWDGKEEINLFGQAFDPAHPEQTIWIVGEAKHNLSSREVERFARQVGRARQNLSGQVFPV